MMKLYVVPTPIGNLKDVSLRVLEVLSAVDRIACEDTRVTAKLLQRYEIRKPLTSYREHNEREAGAFLMERMAEGESIALVSDAGMPGVSDPGHVLIQMALEAGVDVDVLPGPTAFVNALVVSGLPTDRFTFIGFLEKTKKHKRDTLLRYREREETLIFYEAPHRLRDTLAAFKEVLGNRRMAAARELTKLHEETVRGTVAEVQAVFAEKEPRGEFVLVVSGRTMEDLEKERQAAFADLSIRDHLLRKMEDGLTKKAAVQAVALERNLPKKIVYAESIDL